MDIAIIQGPGHRVRQDTAAAMLAGALHGEHLHCFTVDDSLSEASCSPSFIFLLVDQVDSENWRAPADYLDHVGVLAESSRSAWPEGRILLAGRAARAFGPTLLKHVPCADALVLGELETVALVLLSAGDDWKGCAGLAVRQEGRTDGRTVLTPRSESFGLSRMPAPDWSVLEWKAGQAPKVAGLDVSRSRRLACGFQPESVFYPRRGEPIDPVELINRMEALTALGVDEVRLLDPAFPPSPDYLIELSREMLKRDCTLSWSATFDLLQTDEEGLTLAAAAGLTHARFNALAFFAPPLRALGTAWNCGLVWRSLDFARRIPGLRFSFIFFLAAPELSLRMLIPVLLFWHRWRRLPADKRGTFTLTCPRVFPGTRLHQAVLEGPHSERYGNLLSGTGHCFYTSLAARLLGVFL